MLAGASWDWALLFVCLLLRFVVWAFFLLLLTTDFREVMSEFLILYI